MAENRGQKGIIGWRGRFGRNRRKSEKTGENGPFSVKNGQSGQNRRNLEKWPFFSKKLNFFPFFFDPEEESTFGGEKSSKIWKFSKGNSKKGAKSP